MQSWPETPTTTASAPGRWKRPTLCPPRRPGRERRDAVRHSDGWAWTRDIGRAVSGARSEVEASGAVRLGGAEHVEACRLHVVEVPRRRSGRRCAELGREGVAFDRLPASRRRGRVAASCCNLGSSVARTALPSATRSNWCVDTVMTQAGLSARLRDLRVPGPEVKPKPPSTQPDPTGMTCGVPSGFVVASQVVWRFGPPVSGAWVYPPSRSASTRCHSIGGVPYPSRLWSATGWVVDSGGLLSWSLRVGDDRDRSNSSRRRTLCPQFGRAVQKPRMPALADHRPDAAQVLTSALHANAHAVRRSLGAHAARRSGAPFGRVVR